MRMERLLAAFNFSVNPKNETENIYRNQIFKIII